MEQSIYSMKLVVQGNDGTSKTTWAKNEVKRRVPTAIILDAYYTGDRAQSGDLVVEVSYQVPPGTQVLA